MPHNPQESQYLDLLRFVLDEGAWQQNRTGTRTLAVPGAMMRFDLNKGDPIVTTKFVPFKSVTGELSGFLRPSNSAASFRELGCKVWDQNANENLQWLANPFRTGPDSLGPIYGIQWREWPAYKLLPVANHAQINQALALGFKVIAEVIEHGQPLVLLYKSVDQLLNCLETLVKDPTSRRILFHGWNPAQLDEMALPPCHLLYQFLANVERKELSMCLYVRSNDLGLGAPFNMAEGAALLRLMARLSGFKPRWFTYFIGDAHIYEDHLDMVHTMLERTPFEAPTIQIADTIPDYAVTGEFRPELLSTLSPSDFSLQGYQHHPAIKAPMAV